MNVSYCVINLYVFCCRCSHNLWMMYHKLSCLVDNTNNRRHNCMYNFLLYHRTTIFLLRSTRLWRLNQLPQAFPARGGVIQPPITWHLRHPLRREGICNLTQKDRRRERAQLYYILSTASLHVVLAHLFAWSGCDQKWDWGSIWEKICPVLIATGDVITRQGRPSIEGASMRISVVLMYTCECMSHYCT